MLDTEEWQVSSQDVGLLASGTRLAQYEYLVTQTDIALTAAEKAYVKDSLANRTAHLHSARQREACTEGLEKLTASRLMLLLAVI
jgi:hypothetical protein